MKENGYTNIDALDACQEMLEKSKQHNAYTNYITAYLGKNRLPIEDGELLTKMQNYRLSIFSVNFYKKLHIDYS